MIKGQQSIEEINTLLFESETDETEAFDDKEHDVASRQQKTEPRLLRGLSSELEQLEPVPYYKRPVVQAAVLLMFAIPVGWMLISAFSTGEAPRAQLQSETPSSDRENQLLKESLGQERKKNQDLAIENGLRTQQMEVIPVRTKPTPQPVPVPHSPKVVPAPAPRRAYVTRSVEASKPVSYTPPLSRPSAPVIPRPLTPVISKPLAPAKVEPKTDPMEQWLAAANAGSYGDISPTSTSSNQPSDDLTNTAAATEYQTASAITDNSDDWQPSGGIGTKPELNREVVASPTNSIAQANLSDHRPNADHQSANYSNAINSIVVGTRAGGKLETPIAWSGNLQNPEQNFLVQLTSPLLAVDKSVAVPKGAYVVARVSNANAGGLLQMSATSVVLTQNGQKREQPLPEGAILILGKGGKPLQAKATRNHNTGSNLGMVLLSGLGSAAGVANQVTSRSIFSSGGAFSMTATSRDPNYLAGFGQGAAQELTQQMRERNQRARQSIDSQPDVFVLNQGTSVQVFVNQSVSL